ncbi:MAG: LOG family protein [Gemmatimonadota bacterium]|nr:MAG: LOG family protein [Gemmatimonadota bacterium]
MGSGSVVAALGRGQGRGGGGRRGDAERYSNAGKPKVKNEDPGVPPAPARVVVGEETFEVVEEALVDLWAVVNDLARIRPPKPKYYRVTVFGSSRMRRGDQLFDDVRTLARQLSSMGCDVVTGGGPGLMEAANEGARLGDPENVTRSFGLPIELATDEEPNPFVEKIYRHRTFFSRLHHFVRLSSAFIVVPGGLGTLLETAMIWQLCQVKHVSGIPLIFLGRVWEDLVAWAREHMLGGERNLASPADLAIPLCVPGVDEAVEIIRKDLALFNAEKETAEQVAGT